MEEELIVYFKQSMSSPRRCKIPEERQKLRLGPLSLRHTYHGESVLSITKREVRRVKGRRTLYDYPWRLVALCCW
jgi:hypothetical protein